MREIKFRLHVNGLTSDPFPFGEDLITFDNCGSYCSLRDYITVGDVMQYTGLKDQNDVEIYESDLLKNKSGRICVVKWHESAAMFDCEPVVIVKNDNADGFKNNCWSRWIEVIGNIHQNPELLQA